jgi:D-arabinose 1-dehydrogenase-like Zn-dependent alcohol dehydrogenase
MESTPYQFEHSLYKSVKNPKEAEAIGFAFISPEKLDYIPFKFPDLKSDEIRAKMLYSGVCHSDVMCGRGHWGKINYPMTAGHEIIAKVEAVGSDVKDFAIGETVGFGTFRDACGKCKYCEKGRETLCTGAQFKYTYNPHWGGHATHIQQPAGWFFHLPEGLDLAKASPLFCAGTTVFTPIKKHVKKGDKCAVLGLGGLGHMAIQYLSKMGHEVTAVTSSVKDKKELLTKLGAIDFIDTAEEGAFQKNADRFDFIINTIPAQIDFSNYLNMIAGGGTWVQCGNPEVDKNITIPYYMLILKECNITGTNVGTREDVIAMLEASRKYDVYPYVEEFSFEDYPKAFDRLEHGKPFFRCVVKGGDYAEKNLDKK